MTNRLSDERLSEIGVRLLSRTVPTAEEVQAMHDELLALRAAGPVMTERPSEAMLDAWADLIDARRSTLVQLWHEARAALEQV